MSILDVSSISKHFSGIFALRQVGIHVREDEILGLIGPNGAGKSTLLNVISGALDPDEGTVTLNGNQLEGRGASYCAVSGIGRTFQNIRLFGNLTVRENVDAAFTTCQKVRPELADEVSVDEILEELGLLEAEEQFATELPYGHQRRLEIARALALRPQILLLDEPAAGMNDAESAELVGDIRRIKDRYRCSFGIVDHDLRFIMEICERIYVLDMGQIIAEGPPKEIQKNQAVIDCYLGGR